MLSNQRGIATIVLISIIAGAFLVGTAVEHFSHEIDSPLEQAAESILEDYGIEHDFSKDKKQPKNPKNETTVARK